MKAPGFDAARTGFLLETLKPDRLTRVVDIGANPLDTPPYRALFDFGGCEIWGFEPQAAAFDTLYAAAGPNEHYLNAAVGTGEVSTLHICKDSGFTSLLEPNVATFAAIGHFLRGVSVIERVEIETKRLDDLDDLPEFDLLKIDIQGGETAVFAHGAQKLSRAVAVITEVAAVSLYVDQPLLDGQMQALRGHGFDLHKFLFFKSLRRKSPATARLPRRHFHSQLIDGDAVFLRGLLDLARLDDQQLRHQAILADAVYGSHDLTAHLLHHLAAKGQIAASATDAYLDLLLGA